MSSKKIIHIFFPLDGSFYNLVLLSSGLSSGLFFGGVLYMYGYLGIFSMMYVRVGSLYMIKKYEINY
jgi:hypothetical protein